MSTLTRGGATVAAALLLVACSNIGQQVRVAEPDGLPAATAGQVQRVAATGADGGPVVDFGSLISPAASPMRKSFAGPYPGPVAGAEPATAPVVTSVVTPEVAGPTTVGGPVDPWRMPAAVVIDLTTQHATVLDPDGVEIMRLPVSTGGPGTETPEGVFEVSSRQRVGTAEGDDDVHMDFFTVFNGDIGFHGIPWVGTRDERLWTPLGEFGVSHGCIRMADLDAEYLYTYLPDGAPVIVRS